MQPKTKDWEIKVNGVTLKSNTIYEVKAKYDADANPGFKKHNTSKLLSKYTAESLCIPYNEARELWDTGLEENSPRYLNWNSQETKIMVSALKNAIVDPFEASYGEGKLSNKATNDIFWLPYTVDLYVGKLFNTKSEKDALDLYLAVSNYMVTEKNNKENKKPDSIKAKYDIENREFATSFKEDRQVNKMEAIGSFYTLLNNDREKLLNIMEWLEINEDRQCENRKLTSIITLYFEQQDSAKANEFCKKFKDTVAMANTIKGQQEIQNMVDLNILKRAKVLVYEHKEYWIGDILVGSRMKDGAIKAISDKPLQDAIRDEIEKLETPQKLVKSTRK
jgi:hypothetical protein